MSGRLFGRRSFIRKSSVGMLTLPVIYGGLLPPQMELLINRHDIPGKHPDMQLLNDRPLNLEAMAHLLDDPITPEDKFFVRNNGVPPTDVDVDTWSLTIDGESALNPTTFSLNELKSNFQAYSYQLVIECGGNGRSEFNPPANGNQWTVGAVACAKWTGVRVKDVLESVGIADDAVYLAFHGADEHISGDESKEVISRGVPIWKAIENESLIAWQMNDNDIPPLHGYPLRLVIGGWPGSVSGKWLKGLSIRNKVHDGAKMGGSSYRVPCVPVAPGSKVSDEDLCIIESMPVKSLITYPKSGAILNQKRSLDIRGHAWAGDHEVNKVEFSIDFGTTWHVCKLDPPPNRLAWQRFSASVTFPQKGYYEIWARATDSQGHSQPMVVPGWNPKGYLNNACHRIAIKVMV